MMEIPVYFVTGFLDSGKTTFLKNTIFQSDFCSRKERTLLILCEEGEEEYDEKELLQKNIKLVSVEKESDFTAAFLKNCQDTYKPERVLIEYNGTWKVADFVDRGLPKYWVLAQMITMVNAQTYDSYLTNMRQFMTDQMMFTELVIFDRCTKDTKKNDLRKSVKMVNRSAQVVYDFIDGSAGSEEETELPFDIQADIIDIAEEDFGIWYLDAADNPKKYEGKTVRFTAMIYRDKKLPKDSFIPGRFAMTCCANDIAFVGFLCRGSQANYFKSKDWAVVTAKIAVEYSKEYDGDGPVLYLTNIIATKKPEEELVYMY